MVKVNILGDAFKKSLTLNAKAINKVLLRPSSKVLISFLKVMQKHGYIGEFEIVDDHRSNKIVVELVGRINKVGVISPRYDIKMKDYENWC